MPITVTCVDCGEEFAPDQRLLMLGCAWWECPSCDVVDPGPEPDPAEAPREPGGS